MCRLQQNPLAFCAKTTGEEGGQEVRKHNTFPTARRAPHRRLSRPQSTRLERAEGDVCKGGMRMCAVHANRGAGGEGEKARGSIATVDDEKPLPLARRRRAAPEQPTPPQSTRLESARRDLRADATHTCDARLLREIESFMHRWVPRESLRVPRATPIEWGRPPAQSGRTCSHGTLLESAQDGASSAPGCCPRA